MEEQKLLLFRLERVRQMEQYMDEISDVLNRKPESLKKDAEVYKKVETLMTYLDSGQWLADYEADERGELPADLKRGVLSQDTLYNLLCEIKENEKMDGTEIYIK